MTSTGGVSRRAVMMRDNPRGAVALWLLAGGGVERAKDWLGWQFLIIACRQELDLRLCLQWQPPQLDEADGAIVVKGIATIICRQCVLIERKGRAPPDDRAIAAEEF